MTLSQFTRRSMMLIIIAAVAFAAYQAYLILGPKDWSGSRPDGPSVHVINSTDADICETWIERDLGVRNAPVIVYDRKIKSGDDLYYKIEAGTFNFTVFDCDSNMLSENWGIFVENSYDWVVEVNTENDTEE